jgi:hypothetical protein
MPLVPIFNPEMADGEHMAKAEVQAKFQNHEDWPESVIVRKLSKCSRCGGTHLGISCKRLSKPADPYCIKNSQDFFIYRYWTVCPTNGEPLLLALGDGSLLTGNVIEREFVCGVPKT